MIPSVSKEISIGLKRILAVVVRVGIIDSGIHIGDPELLRYVEKTANVYMLRPALAHVKTHWEHGSAYAVDSIERASPSVIEEREAGDSLVIKERRATFTPTPGLEETRPSAETEYPNLFLAGDWTATGYPATIEGAVLSGQKAAEMVLAGK